MSEVHLMEGLGLVEPVAVLGADHVGVEIFLRLPRGAIEEVHGRAETTSHGGSRAGSRSLHPIVEVDHGRVHVADPVSQVHSLLESRVRECLSGSGGGLGVPDAGVRDGEGRLAVAVVDRVPGAVSARDLRSVEPISEPLISSLIDWRQHA